MRRAIGAAIVVCLLATGCSGLGAGSTARRVQVDYRNDRFGSHYWRFFPHTIDAHAGDEVVFHQQWTGEPHTVTFGRLVDQALPRMAAVEKRYAKYGDSPPPDIVSQAERELAAAAKGLPQFDPYRDAAAQNAQQPCYLTSGAPPTDPRTACPKHPQPAFTGRQNYYSSGFLPPAGASGSEFRVKLADNVRSGTYHFYCVIHFPFMQGSLVVKPKNTTLASDAEVNRRAHAEIVALSRPLEKAFASAHAGTVRTEGSQLRPPIAGFHSSDEFTVAIDSFIPRTVTTKVGEPITWTIVGAHTVSFGVPKFLPIYMVQKDGTVRRNPVVDRPAGGSPRIPPIDFTHSTYRVDGGTYDGTGFFSSGLLGSEPFSAYTLRFARPGRYRYACLVHPPMVGTVIVES